MSLHLAWPGWPCPAQGGGGQDVLCRRWAAGRMGRAGAGWAVGTVWGSWEPGDRNAVTGSFSSPGGCRLPPRPPFLHAFCPQSWTLDSVLRPGAVLVTPQLPPPVLHLLVLGPSSRMLSGSLQGGSLQTGKSCDHLVVSFRVPGSGLGWLG